MANQLTNRMLQQSQIKDPPSTIQELEELSASGKRIGLATNF